MFTDTNYKIANVFYSNFDYLYSMSISEIQLYNASKSKLGDNEAQQLVDFVKSKVTSEFNERKDTFLTKEDKIDIMRSIYIVGIVQFLAIVGSVLAIMNFMLKS